MDDRPGDRHALASRVEHVKRHITNTRPKYGADPGRWHLSVTEALLVVVAVASLGFTAYQYRQAQAEQERLPPYLTVTSTVEETGSEGSLIALRGSITVENNGDASVKVVAGYYNLVGFSIHEASGTTGDREYLDAAATAFETPDPQPLATRHYSRDRGIVTQSGGIFQPGITRFEGGETYTFTFTAFVPEGVYDVIGLYPFVHYTRSGVRLDPYETTLSSGAVRYDDLLVRVEWKTSGTPQGWVSAQIFLQWDGGQWLNSDEIPDFETFERFREYWVVYSTAEFELPLWR